MRIIVTSQSSALGGVERRLESEALVLKSLGWDVVISLPNFAGKKAWQLKLENLGCSFVNWNPYKFIERSHSSCLMKWPLSPSRIKIRRLRPDVAHVALPWTVTGMSRVAQLTELGVPVILSLHCTYPFQEFNSRDKKNIADALAGVVGAYAVSESVRQSFLRNFADYSRHFSVQVISNGVDCKKFSSNPVDREFLRASLGATEKDFLIVFCGRMEEMKRPQFALRAMAHDDIRGRRIKMVMLGDGPLLSSLKEYAVSSGIDKNISFLGFVQNPEIYYRVADYYVSTSSASEGFGLSVGEALASGLPSLLPDSPVFKECFSNCQAVSFFDPDSMEGFVRRVLDASDFSEAYVLDLKNAAIDYAKNALDVSLMLDELKVFYINVLSRLKRAGAS